MNDYGESTFFSAPAFGLIVGDLGGGKDKEKGGSGLISPFGITLTPGIALGRMGFIVISFGIHFQRRIGFGIVIPIFPLWG